MAGDCHRRLLASGHACRVERCSCGTLHVSLGTLTLRLDPAIVADAAATLERALSEIDASRVDDGAPPPPHDPAEREIAQTIGDWEVRVFADGKFGFFVERGLWHVQLWHPGARVSVLTPSRLTGDAYEIFSSSGWKRRATAYADVARFIAEQHAVPFLDEDTLRRIEHVFVSAPIAFAASPEGAS